MNRVTILAADGTTVGNPVANIAIFGLFVAVTLFIVIRASKKNATAAEFFTAGRSFTGPQNGIAISGDYLSAASFLGIAGAIAVYGYDGFLYSIGFRDISVLRPYRMALAHLWAAGQGHVLQVRKSLVSLVVGEHHLTAPHRVVGSVAGAIEGESEYLL